MQLIRFDLYQLLITTVQINFINVLQSAGKVCTLKILITYASLGLNAFL